MKRAASARARSGKRREALGARSRGAPKRIFLSQPAGGRKPGDDGRLRAIVAEPRSYSKTSDAARRRLDYIVRNRRRMRCPRFRAHGLRVSSGVVEAGCKQVVGARLKRAGMRWTVAGANAITALRCCQISGRCEDYRERRAARAA